MVEPSGPPKTQLPTAKPSNEAAAATDPIEETKEEGVYMYGDVAQVSEDIFERLNGLDMNVLEQGLIKRGLTDPSGNRQMLENTFAKLSSKNATDNYCMKRLKRTAPLFMVHEFWGSQPVPNYYDCLPLSAYNKAVEVKTAADVSQTPLPLPAGYEWVTIDLNNDDEANEVYQLLSNHYVEDTEGKFRFDYSINFLRWALNPPG